MLNKPKFLSPSINMYGNSVVNFDMETTTNLPFSCIVDGNEAITHWQIVVYRLSGNIVALDTGKQELNPYFLPVNNRNQNVVFNINLADYIKKDILSNPATSTYDSKYCYYTYSESTNEYKQYSYNESTWETDYPTLYRTLSVNLKYGYECYWTITLWGTTGTKVSSSSEVFYANRTPKTTIYYSYDNNFFDNDGKLNEDFRLSTDDDNISVLSKRKVFFKSTYSQKGDVPIKRYGWRLTDITNGVVVMDTITKNQIYGVGDDISCVCNGLINQGKYSIELYIETQNGDAGILNKINFQIEYDVHDIDADFDIVALNNTSGIMLNWGNLKTTEGTVEGEDVGYSTNYPIAVANENAFPSGSKSIDIPENSRVVFSDTANGKSLKIDENSYVVLSFQINKTADMVLFEMSGFDDISNSITRKLYYDYTYNTLIYEVQKGDIVVSSSVALSKKSGQVCWYVVTLSPMLFDNGTYASLKVVENTADNALFPSGETGYELYPEDELYPKIGEWVINGEE